MISLAIQTPDTRLQHFHPFSVTHDYHQEPDTFEIANLVSHRISMEFRAVITDWPYPCILDLYLTDLRYH